MPKGKTGKPRGRPHGTRDIGRLSEEAIFIALGAIYNSTGIEKPVLARLAKLLADPKTDTWREQCHDSIVTSIKSPKNMNPEQLKDAVHYAVQRRNETHGPNYLSAEPGRTFIIRSAHLAYLLLVERHPFNAEFFSEQLRGMGWNPIIVDRVHDLSRLARAVNAVGQTDGSSI